MKTLPDNPNLDHLRQQAKDLLAGLRDSDPTAKLSDAQASLADRYGFRGWTELKAEVERMRGRAEVAGQALATALAEVTGPMRSLARHDELGRPWSLETEKGRWLVRNVDDAIRIVDVETEVALQHQAAERGVLLLSGRALGCGPRGRRVGTDQSPQAGAPTWESRDRL